MKLATRVVLPLALFLALVPAARAATCQVSATDLAFGPYSSTAVTDRDTEATVTIQCTPDLTGASAAYSIELSAGASGSFMPRSMSGDAAALQYNVYADASRTLVWGDGSGGSLVVAGVIDGVAATSASHTLYGRMPAGQTGVAPGLYADMLTISVTY